MGCGGIDPLSILLVKAMIAVLRLEASAETKEHERTMLTPKQLSNVKLNHNFDLFKTTCVFLKIPRRLKGSEQGRD